ncbi:hypothetical protein SAMN05444374_11612 [Rhodococcoides kroppenstedtii]|uniref:Uncharacterized protein n=1 Tax=Rhodococcoides kroppenstedtii TaxID=293050 RepID=A0A1I0U9P3_9NOCA|nr:hypothetical protein [Rhodococcus kroppenstedtii]SFA60744.1 hypothetical protein SAMN05444374_11612 [Rhodococcus kroppenstedtii]
MTLSIGRTVLYTLSADDAAAITKRRADFAEHRKTDDYRDTGYVAHVGNQVREGDVFPAVVIRVWEAAGSANLHVLLDGTDTFWACSVSEGKGPRTWAWPPRV